MPEITSREQLDLNKLKELFKKRGHGIISPDFLEKTNDILDGNEKGLRVFQCTCGEVSFILNEMAEKVIAKYGSNDLPCRKCNPKIYFEDNLFVFSFVPLFKFQEINEYISKNCNSPSFVDDFNKTFSEYTNITSVPESFYLIYKSTKTLFEKMNTPETKLMDELFNYAKQYPVEFTKLLTRNTKLFKIQKENSVLSNQKSLSLSKLYFQNKLFGMPDDMTDKDFEKSTIQSKLDYYNHLVEEKDFQNVLINLVKISEGLPFSETPFTKKTLFDKLEEFKCYSRGVPVFYYVKEVYNNKIRNAKAHNDYQIITESDLIKYKENISITDFERLIEKLEENQSYVYYKLATEYFECFPVIREVKYVYDSFLIKDDEIIPEDEFTLPEIHIEGYNFKEINIPLVKLNFDNNFMKTEVGSGYELIDMSRIKKWLTQLINCDGKYNVTFVNILNIDPKIKRLDGKIMPIIDLNSGITKCNSLSPEDLKQLKNMIDNV